MKQRDHLLALFRSEQILLDAAPGALVSPTEGTRSTRRAVGLSGSSGEAVQGRRFRALAYVSANVSYMILHSLLNL